MSRPLVLVTEHLDPAATSWLAERCEVLAGQHDDPAIAPRLDTIQALVVRTYTRVDEALLERTPALRVVGRAGVGLDNIDVPACRRRAVEVVYTPDANSEAVVELVLALLLDALRRREYLAAPPSPAEWRTLRNRLISPRQLHATALGIWGLGRIGSRLARVGVALGMQVRYHDLVEIPVERRWGAMPVGRDELLRTSEVLSLHVDGRRANRALVNADVLSRVRPDVVLVNASRGMVVDTPALAAFLRAHPDALALLDVHDPEPIEPACPLLPLANARLTPHVAAATGPAHRAMSWVVRDVWRVLAGERPEWPAPPEH